MIDLGLDQSIVERTVMNSSLKDRRRVRVCGVSVDSVTLSGVFGFFDRWIQERTGHYVCFCEAHLCVRASTEAEINNHRQSRWYEEGS